MPLFQYNARAKDGKKISGDMEADNVDAVVEQLRSIGVFPLKISEKKVSDVSSVEISFGKKQVLTTQDLVFFSRQMYTLSKASVPLMQALDGLLNSSTNPALEGVIKKLRKSLDEGIDFTQALKRQRDVFPDIFINMVNIGETTGKLAEVFLELSSYLQKEKDTNDKIKSALRYPVIVLSIIGVGMIIVSVFVLPKFTKMFSGFNAELPLPTQVLIGLSDFMADFWWICVGVPVALFIAFLRYTATDEGKLMWHKYQLSIPLFGPLILKGNITRFANSLSITGRAGVPVVQALRIIAPTISNKFIAKKIDTMCEGVERGESVAVNIKRMDLFPGMVVQMMTVGEESGSLDTMVSEIAEFYERELDYTVKSLTSSIEPIVIVFMAGLVLILALGIFLPMISLIGSMG